MYIYILSSIPESRSQKVWIFVAKSSKKFGQDLEKILAESIKNNIHHYLEITETEMNIIFLINETYKEKELEYFLLGYKSLPNYSELIKFAKKINDGLSAFVRETS